MVLQFVFQVRDLFVGAVPPSLQPAVLVGAVLLVPLLFRLVAGSKNKSLPANVRLPPTLPGTLLILGDALEILKHKADRHDWITSLCEHFQGRPFQMRMPGRPVNHVIYTVETVEDVLKTHFENVPKGPTIRGVFRDVLGEGIFAVDGHKWVHQRKTASNLFTARALRDMMTESMRTFAVQLQKLLQQKSDRGEHIDVFKLMNAFTMQAFAKMGFGADIDCLDAPEEHPFQSAFDSSQRLLMRRALRPTWLWHLERWLNIGAEAQLKRDIAVIDSTVMTIISQSLVRRQEKQQRTSEDDTGFSDIVSIFLDRFDSTSTEKGEFDPTYLRDIVVNFLIAGRDTTAQAMSWCLYNLHKNPEVVRKIREEIARELPTFFADRNAPAPTMEQVQQLTYLEATLKETLRLHPSVPFIPKAATEDMILSDGTFIKGGSTLGVSTYSMARMTSIWGPDAKQFNPDRWIDPSTGKLLTFSAYKFVSFNAGPRLCLGMNLAMLEMKIVIATVVSRFNIQFDDIDSITYTPSLTLPVRGAMMARVTSSAP